MSKKRCFQELDHKKEFAENQKIFPKTEPQRIICGESKRIYKMSGSDIKNKFIRIKNKIPKK